ncbi:MAG TPA: N-acetylneuraminate synthase family protein [Nitrosopumilaceae archaeon]|nr:N-acetylneuraminate synthase family protein [Nitrosopumilaceae archaeon]
MGIGEPCYVIAEIGINHNGQVPLAKKLIDVAVEAGADAVKFQKRSLESIYKNDVLENPNLDSQGLEILINVLKEVEFNESEYQEIIEYCKKKEIPFLCTPWDTHSVDFLEKFNVPAYKIASADMTNLPLIHYVAKAKKPLIISTGMSTLEEIEKTVNFVKKENIPFILLHCNSTYPSPVELLNLNLIPLLRTKFDVPIGYSGHEPGIIPSLAAANMESVLIERHITLDKTMEGIDQAASLEPDEFKNLVQYIRESEKAKGESIKKMTRGEILQREVLGKSIICSLDIHEGDIFSEQNVEIKGPAKGLSPQYYYDIIGKKSTRNIKKGQYLLPVDLK